LSISSDEQSSKKAMAMHNSSKPAMEWILHEVKRVQIYCFIDDMLQVDD
jgi:hypothetical protein